MAVVYQICIAQSTEGAETWVNINSLGIVNPVRNRMICGVDTLSFTVQAATAMTDASDYFAAKTLIRFRKLDGSTPTLLFLGRVYPIARSADGPSESYQVQVRGMWDWFENTPMRQEWTESETTLSKPRVILFCDSVGDRMTTGAQIEQCVAVARAAGCPCAESVSGDIMTGWTPPFDEQTNISVANALNKALANHPHASCWFDYSERAPRLYVRTRQSLTSVSVSVAGQVGIKVRSREDLQPPALAIVFERENTDDGDSHLQTVIDHAPVIAGESASATQDRLNQVDAIWGVFDLIGSSRQTVSQKIETEAFAGLADLASKAWWKKHVPWLADYADADIELDASTAARSGTLNLSRILTDGAIQEWMTVDTEREQFSVSARLTRRADEEIAEVRDEKLNVELPMTSATTKTYRKLVSYDSGESIPEGLAAAMWAEWLQLHHECTVSIVEEEPSLALAPGKTLNLTGGMSAWASMAAMIVRVTEQFSSGMTTVEVGVPGWVDLDSRVAWYRACRTRRYAFSRKLRQADGDADDGGTSEVASKRDGSTPGQTRQLVVSAVAGEGGSIQLKPEQLDDDETIGVRTISWHDGAGTTQTAKILATTAIVQDSWPFGDQYSFGMLIIGATVKIYPGTLEVVGAHLSSETTLTVTATGQFVGLELRRSDFSLAVTISNTRHASDDDYYRTALYSFDFDGTVITKWHDHIHDIRQEAVF